MSSHPNAADEADHLTRQLQADWLAFAITGDPGWDPYDRAARRTRVYATTPTTEPYPEDRSRHIWQHHRFGVLELPQR